MLASWHLSPAMQLFEEKAEGTVNESQHCLEWAPIQFEPERRWEWIIISHLKDSKWGQVSFLNLYAWIAEASHVVGVQYNKTLRHVVYKHWGGDWRWYETKALWYRMRLSTYSFLQSSNL